MLDNGYLLFIFCLSRLNKTASSIKPNLRLPRLCTNDAMLVYSFCCSKCLTRTWQMCSFFTAPNPVADSEGSTPPLRRPTFLQLQGVCLWKCQTKCNFGNPPQEGRWITFLKKNWRTCFFMFFGKIVCWRPLEGWCSLLRGILDPAPPLPMSRHWWDGAYLGEPWISHCNPYLFLLLSKDKLVRKLATLD